MEWTKESLIGTCILCTSIKQGAQIIKFYESFGFSSEWNGTSINCYYGISEMTPKWVSYENSSSFFEHIIELPSKPRRKFPREMWVSNSKTTVCWIKRMVVAKNTKAIRSFIAIQYGYSITDVHIEYQGWKYAKEIE